MKTLLASVVLTAFVGFGVAQANVSDFTDASGIPSWADEAIEELMDQGVLAGNDDGSFAPNRQLNRAEVSKIIVLATGIDMDTTGGPHFPDVASDAWYYDYIETMYNQGWINGYPDGMFRPGVGINRVELAKMVVNAFEIDQDLSGAPHFDDVNESDWFYGFVETAYNNGIMTGYGDGTFGPANAVTRAETAKIVYDSQLVVLDSFGGLTAGTLEVMLSSQTPRGTNIPYNATSVPFTTVEFTASDDADVEIGSVTFTRLGLGDNDSFDNVWMEIDGFKVGNDKSVNNDDVVELRFNPPIVVPAGQTIVADLVASMEFTDNDTNVGQNNRFAIVSAEDIVSSASNVVGDFPIEGEEMEIANYEVTQVSFSRLGADSTVNVGDSFVEIGKFRMLNESETNKDVEFRAITFKNDGTAELEDVLENVALYVSGEQVSAETIMDGDYVTFRLDNGVTGGYILEDGDSKIFSVRADIVSAERGDVINFKVDNFEDVVGVEIGTAFGVKAISGDSNGLSLDTGAGTTSTNTTTCTDESAEDACARLRAYAIDSGDLSISRDPSSLGNQEYAPGSNDIVFMTARIVADQPIIVDGVTLDLADSTNVADLAALNTYFDNFRLYLNDKLLDSENDFTGASLSEAELAFNTTFEIAGTSVLKLVGNIQDETPTGVNVKLSLNQSGGAFDSPEYISTGDQISADEIVGSALASFVEVQESNLTITRTDGLSDGDNIVAGVDDVTFLEFVLDNNDSGDVNVTSIAVQGIGNGAGETYQNYTAAIFVDGVQQGSARNLETTGSATFNDLSVVVPSASQKSFEVVVDTIESSATSALASTVVADGAGTTQVTGFVTTLLNGEPVANATTLVVDSSAGLTVGDVITIGVGDENFSTTVATIPNATSITIPANTQDFEDNDIIQKGGSTLAAAIGASSSNFTVVNGAVFSVGDQVAISLDGLATGGNAEVKTITAINGNIITVGSPFVNSHAMAEIAGLITTQYPALATSFTVASAVNISVNDVLTVNTTETCNVTAVSGTTITCNVGFVAPVPVGATVTENNSTDNIRFAVTALDADNIENGQNVDVLEDGVVLGTSVNAQSNATGTNLNADCSAVPAAAGANYLCGVRFDLVSSGTLTIADGPVIVNSSNIIVAGATDVEIWEIRFSAANDDIEVKDIYLTNTGTASAGRATFKLYDEAGTLLATESLTGSGLHFELGNSSRIRVPKDGTTSVSIKVDVNSINQANQTGTTIDLDIDETQEENGVEATTTATGSDLAAAAVTNTSTTSETYVAYRTAITFANAATQASYAPSVDAHLYRFTVSNDSAYEALLNKVTLNLTFSANTIGTIAPANLELVKYSDSSYSGTPTAVLDAAGAGAVTALVFDGFEDEVDGTSYYAVRTDNVYLNSASDNDSILGQIVTDGALVAPQTGPAVGPLAAANVVWSDRSNQGAAGQYLNGFELIVPSTAAGVQE